MPILILIFSMTTVKYIEDSLYNQEFTGYLDVSFTFVTKTGILEYLITFSATLAGKVLRIPVLPWS
ncbi:MAG: hypothetical protein A2330_01485 [Ignavibacteria bacterium RIFOXYB2_FULL_36_7]|nr:MAG: hypothetical protein A2330_01485 [Ignavibacteria bacterium RIFOXYB2_FULL_36_7]